MTFHIDRIPAPVYLHVVVTGEETLENLREVWTRIAHMSREMDAKLILCEGYLEGAGDTIALYKIGEEFPRLGFPPDMRIAVVCKKSKYPDFKFAENVAVNRGGNFVSVFTDIDLAKDWLQTH